MEPHSTQYKGVAFWVKHVVCLISKIFSKTMCMNFCAKGREGGKEGGEWGGGCEWWSGWVVEVCVLISFNWLTTEFIRCSWWNALRGMLNNKLSLIITGKGLRQNRCPSVSAHWYPIAYLSRGVKIVVKRWGIISPERVDAPYSQHGSHSVHPFIHSSVC